MEAPWLAFYPKDFFASAKVQALPHIARSIYLHLLFRCWNTEDCSLPGDTESLMENSETTAEEWATYGPQVLRNFVALENGRLRNSRLYREWTYAREVHEKRRAASLKANKARWHGDEVQPNSDPDIHESGKAVNNEAAKLAGSVMDALHLVASEYDIDTIGQVITLEARGAHLPLALCAKYLLGAAQRAIEHGHTVNSFWFKDRKFAVGANGNGKPSNPGVQPTDTSDAHALEAWESMTEAYKKENPWPGLGAADA